MPRELPTGLIALLKSGFAETHSTLAISLLGAGRSIKNTIYLATAAEGGGTGPAGPPPVAAVTVPNSGFETPVIPPPGYQYAPSGAAWTMSNAGIIQGSLFGSGPAPEGGQIGFITTTGVMYQTLTGFVGGTNYEIRLKAFRQYAADLPDFDVYMDAINVGRIAPTSATAAEFVLPFTAGQTSYTLKFQGVNTAGQSISVMIDDVRIVPAAGGITRGPGGRGPAYLPRLRQTGPVAMSLTRSADRVDVVIENIDRLSGNQFVAVQDSLYGSFAEFGRLWRDLRNPANVYQLTLLTGQVVAARASETEVQLTLMSDIYSSGAIAGQILYGRSCPWTFKDAATCAYVGPLATCNKLLTDPDGCSGRANEFHFGGFPYIKSVDTISGASALQQNVQYQTILTPAALTREELEAGARATTAILQRHNLLLQGFTITDDAANDATKIVAGGVGGANYQTLKENDGYSYVRTLPPQPTLNFLNAFKLTDDPGNTETDVSTYGVPTGQLNVRTDFKASGSIDVTNIASFNMSGIVTVTTPLNLQPGMGILIEGAGAGGGDFLGTVGAVSADWKTYVLTTAFATAPLLGNRVQADDTAAVQAWFTAHGDLAMPPGYYRLTSSIVLPTTSEGYSIIVHGSGWDLSVFAFQHHGDGFVPTAPDLKLDSVVFKDLTIGTGTKWDTGGLIDAQSQGFGFRLTAPTLTGIYNNVVLERCRVIGWGRMGFWSDNAEVCWLTQCIFRENKHGHVALIAPDQIEAPKQPNANTITSCTFDQAYGGGDATRTATGSMTAARPVDTGDPPLTQAEIDAARTLTVSGVTLSAADRGRMVIVQGVGTNVSNLYSFIDVYLSPTSCRLAHDCRTTGTGAVTIFSSSVASIFLNRAHDTVIDGATIQGNFTNALTTVDCNAIRADGCANLRIVGVHEEDAGGAGGAAIRLENCQSVTIENYGGTSAGAPSFTNAHGADFQLINTHGVRVSQCYFNDRPQFNMDGNSDAEIDNSLVTGHNNLWQGDASWERLKIGSGVRTYQAADARTNQTAGNEYMYDGLLAREVLLNSRFIDAPAPSTTSWATTNPSYWTLVYGSPERFDSYLRVNATAAGAGGGVKIFSQTVAVPDSIPAGAWILGVDWYIESDAHITAVGAYVEVRVKPSVGIEETLQWSSRSFNYVTQIWQAGQVKAWLGAGTGRTIEVQVNVTPGPSNPIIRLTNFRLTRGKHSFGAWARPVTDFGGKMRAPLEFEPVAVPPAAGGYPPPASGSPVLSLVNIAGVLNLGKNGAYTPLGTPGGPGTILGPANYYALFKDPLGDSLDYGSLKQEASQVHVLNAALKIDQQRALTSVYTSSGLAATLALCDSDDVCYFGPEFTAAGNQAGANVTIRAAHGDVSSLQIAGAERRMTFNRERALTGMAAPLPTFFLGISDLNLDGLRIQQSTAGLYLGYMLSCFFSDAAPDALFAVDQKGGLARLNNLSYPNWPSGHVAGGYLRNDGSGNLTWAAASSGGHVIADEGVALATQRGILNFVGPGVTASDDAAGTRTNVKIETASVTQEGAVSTSASGPQHFSGAKYFHNGATVYLDNSGSAVALVVQSTGGSVGAHIQDWWSGGVTALAYLDTQPNLRLGIPGGADGYLELCSAGVGALTVKLGCGIGATQDQVIRFPLTRPTAIGQTLTVLSGIGSANVNLQWSAAGASGHVIYEETTPLAQRANLKFQGSGVTATDNGTDTVITLNPATATLEGIVSSIGQTFGGRKTFNAGAVMQGLASTVPVLTVQLSSDATSTARLQEWRDPAGSVLGYYSATALHLGAQGFLDGMLELASASSAFFTTLRAATFPAASIVYVLPVATPTASGQVLAVDTIVGSVVNTKWQTGATGSGNVTVTAPQGTDLTVPRWSGTSPTTALVDSNIIDKTSTTGTIQFTCNQLLFKRLDTSTDISDLYMRAGSGASAILRFDHRSGGGAPGSVEDSLNTGGEFQVHFEGTGGGGTGPEPAFLVGSVNSWVQGGLRIRPGSGNAGTVGNAFEIRTSGDAPAFYVNQQGNPGTIKGIAGYIWPGGHAAGVLTNNGSGGLSWGPGGTGGITGTGTVNWLPRVATVSGSNVLTVKDSGISDDNVGVALNDRWLKVWNNGGYASGADLSDIQLVSVSGRVNVLRYENRTVAGGGIADDVNAAGGEFQVWLQGNAKPTLMVGTNKSYFSGGVYVKPPGGFAYSAFELQSAAGAVRFQVLPSGNITTINGIGGYGWPLGHVNGYLKNDGAGNLSWQTPAGVSGANIQLSNLDNTGTISAPAVRINTHLGFSVDGGWNIGAPSQRVGSMYLLGTFFMYPAGSTNASSPRAFGFLDPGGAPAEYTRVLLSGNQAVAQSGFGRRLQITAYYALELRGSRADGNAPNMAITGAGNVTDPGVVVYQENDKTPLQVNTVSTIASDLFVCQNFNVSKLRVGSAGTLITQGGTQFKAKEIQPGGAGQTTTVLPAWRTIIVDTWFGYHTLQLPSAQANPGMIIDVIHMRAIQSILGLVQGRDQAIYIQTNWLIGGSDVFNAWPTANTQASQFILAYPGTNGLPVPDNQHKMVKLIADESLAIWWLMPYYI
jgi:hypothetical protein